MKKHLSRKGYNIIELIVVMVIMGIFLVAFSYQISRWIRRYNIEGDIRQMHIDLLYAKKIAMNRNITEFFQINAVDKKTYIIVEDSNRNETLDSADCQSGNDCRILRYVAKNNISSTSYDAISFDYRGIGDNQTYCIFSSVSPAVDCIVVSNTSINIGKIINQAGGCNANNCRQK